MSELLKRASMLGHFNGFPTPLQRKQQLVQIVKIELEIAEEKVEEIKGRITKIMGEIAEERKKENSKEKSDNSEVLLEKHGWKVIPHSHIEHEDGSTASGVAADFVIEGLEKLEAMEQEGNDHDLENIERKTVVLASFGHNDVLDEPFMRLYEFGYYTISGCVVYKQGECNMQDASAFKMNQIKIATPEEIEGNLWG